MRIVVLLLLLLPLPLNVNAKDLGELSANLTGLSGGGSDPTNKTNETD